METSKETEERITVKINTLYFMILLVLLGCKPHAELKTHHSLPALVDIGDFAKLKHAIEVEKRNVDEREKIGSRWTALMMAVELEKVAIVRYLIQKGADPNRHEHGNQETSLMKACRKGNFVIIDILLKNGGDTSKLNITGKTAYDLFVESVREDEANKDIYEDIKKRLKPPTPQNNP